jgi:transposase-like protein
MEQVVRSLPQAYRIIKERRLYGDEESEYRGSARESLQKILEDRMHDRIDRHLEGMVLRDEEDRCNGLFSRHLLTELGDISLSVPRTRTMSGAGVIRAYSRRAVHVDRMILSCFVWGLSTMKVSHALKSIPPDES